MAFTGQFLKHAWQPVQSFSTTEKSISSLQTPALHFLSLICSSYSFLKYLSVVIIGFGAVLPNPHRERSFTFPERSVSLSRSSIEPLPAAILSNISSNRVVPTRQKVHFPQDSFWVKVRKNFATSTIQVSASITTIPPEPIIAPVAAMLS